jgi:hypothetical protein
MKMKAKIFLIVVALALVMSSTGSDCVRSPFIVSINLGPMEGCYGINPGDTMWGDFIAQIPIRDLIDDNFEDDVTAFRLYDIKVKVSDSFPDGDVSGTVWYSFDTPLANDSLLTFAGPSSRFKGEGASILDQQDLFTIDPDVLIAFVGTLNDPQLRPEYVVLRSNGTSPVVPAGGEVCVDIYVQADAKVE